MDVSLILSNILNPPVLAFFLGMLAVLLKSDLEIPPPLPKLFSLYLLFAIGFKGGVELVKSGITQPVILTLIAAIAMACIVPIYTFFILRVKLDVYNAGAIAATYGSISAVTFITAGSFLTQLGISFDGYMVAALALMESPAIIIGLILVNLFSEKNGKNSFNWSEVLHEATLNSSVYLLVGSLIMGILTGESGWQKLKPFTQDMFYGVLTFFLLDMGLVAAQRIKDLQKTGLFLISFAILIPIVNAVAGLLIAKLIGLQQGDSLLFSVLCASASYIAVPAAMRMTVPEANPSLYVSTALAVTFPFNIIVGIPLYLYGINLFEINMLEVKRIEIIANYVELGKILQGLEKAGIENCTVIRDVAGTSTRGDSKHNLAMTMLDNVYIIAFCPPEKIAVAAESIRSILNKYGGSCFISDALELLTTKCIS